MSGPRRLLCELVTTQDGGVFVSDLRFSNSAEPYILTLSAGPGYAGQQQSVALPAGSSRRRCFNVHSVPTTTTVTVSSTTTTGLRDYHDHGRRGR